MIWCGYPWKAAVPVICLDLLTLYRLVGGVFFHSCEVDHSNRPGSCYNSRVHAHGQMGQRSDSELPVVEGDIFIVTLPLLSSSL